MEMEILSKEMIKPSSSTPQHLHKHNLSFLDQTAPPTYVHLVFFYDSIISQNLKQSLSQVLTRYYPLAGRITIGQGTDPPYVDCNDAGVQYVETRVHARMSEVVTEDPNPGDLQNYVWNFQFDGQIGKIPLSIQSNLFDCGGVAVGVSISHNIADMASLVMFMNDWSATCRQSQQQLGAVPIDIGPGPEPDFNILSSHFPARSSMVTIPSPPPPDESSPAPQRVAMKRFVFGKEILSELKRVGSSSEATDPSRVEAVTAFLWGSTININSATTNFAAIHAVNVRSKMIANPSLAARGFGNGCAQAVALWDGNGLEGQDNNIPALITAKLRGALRAIDVGKIRDHDQHFGGSNVEFCIFSSWCRFPVYEVDYGWGKPHWVATVGVPFKNLVALLDTRNGDGIEAWVSMAETDMALVEAKYNRLCMQLATPA
ncbi:vinorine synthase [Phtheirospermum japonicum]|uniref:Vinorine synthase n=1 Tax=Phtheirospermum japonicum TaxID=374723 RepID=A0A830B3M5_9LAMI|nr:vinorine synthase [Phtheirospermum japonicum]